MTTLHTIISIRGEDIIAQILQIGVGDMVQFQTSQRFEMKRKIVHALNWQPEALLIYTKRGQTSSHQEGKLIQKMSVIGWELSEISQSTN